MLLHNMREILFPTIDKGVNMAFGDENHIREISKIEALWQSLAKLEEYAREHGIEDIFQDNGAKVLQQHIYLHMKNIPGREGNDGRTENGVEWEMKSINLDTSASGFSTNHHTNHDIIAKYRRVPWSFAIYHGIVLEAIYVMSPIQLEPLFQHWEEKLNGGMTHLNNPKIPVSYVVENGRKVYPIDYNNPIDPQSICDDLKKTNSE